MWRGSAGEASHGATPGKSSQSVSPHATGVCEIFGCWVHLTSMSTCPSCQYPATKRDGYDVAGRQRYHCRPCRRDFTAHSASAFSGYRWPPDVILMAVRWYCSLPLSAAQVVRLLAERHIDVTTRTVLNWVQTFGPQLAAGFCQISGQRSRPRGH